MFTISPISPIPWCSNTYSNRFWRQLLIILIFFIYIFSGLLSKSKGQILRMTGCLHCLFQLDALHESNAEEFEPATVVTESAVKAAVNFVQICTNHTLYLCGRNASVEEVRMLQDITSVQTPAPPEEPVKS